MANFNTHMTKQQILNALQGGLNAVTASDLDDLQSLLEGEIDLSLARVDDALVYLVNNAPKNIFNTAATTETIGEVTFTKNNDGTWTTTATGATAARRQKALNFTIPASLPAGTYVLSGCPAGGISGKTTLYCLYIWDLTANTRVSQNDTGNGVEFEWTPDPTHSYNITVDIRSGTNPNGLTFKPMICAKAAYDISPKFVQYAPSNRELYAMIHSL